MEFTIGGLYARRDVHEVLGGGEPQSYLPQVKGQNRIAAGLFKRDKNPEVPNEIQVGRGVRNVKKAELLSRQGDDPIPVFVKRTNLRMTDRIWQFYGMYKFKELLDNKSTLRQAEQKSGRHNELTYVLRLERVSD